MSRDPSDRDHALASKLFPGMKQLGLGADQESGGLSEQDARQMLDRYNQGFHPTDLSRKRKMNLTPDEDGVSSGVAINNSGEDIAGILTGEQVNEQESGLVDDFLSLLEGNKELTSVFDALKDFDSLTKDVRVVVNALNKALAKSSIDVNISVVGITKNRQFEPFILETDIKGEGCKVKDFFLKMNALFVQSKSFLKKGVIVFGPAKNSGRILTRTFSVTDITVNKKLEKEFESIDIGCSDLTLSNYKTLIEDENFKKDILFRVVKLVEFLAGITTNGVVDVVKKEESPEESG